MNITRDYFLAALLGVASMASAADAVYLRADKSFEKVELSTIKTFVVGQKFTVLKKDGRQNTNVKTLIFGEKDNVENYNSEEDGIVVYPNPVSSVLYVEGISDTPNVFVYDVNGEEVLKTKDSKVDVSSLKSGLYMVKVAGKYVKFIKK